jgi:hypothetical protein
MRELGVGLGLAKLADPEAIPDRLFGDFVQLVFELMRTAPQGKPGGAASDERRA